jgi:hypothetical protein
MALLGRRIATKKKEMWPISRDTLRELSRKSSGEGVDIKQSDRAKRDLARRR